MSEKEKKMTEDIETEEKNQEEVSTESENDNENTKENEEESALDIIKKQEETIQQYKDKIQRTQADFENFKKRSEKERLEFVKFANEGLILKVLEAYEDLERALEVEDDKNLREGVELIYKKMTKILEDEGVEPIDTNHQKFDPFKHEALMTENNDDYENNEIIQDLQKGYTLNSKVIRYSKVKVCKK